MTTINKDVYNLFRSKRFEIDYGGAGWLLLSIYDVSLANRVNRAVKKHQDYTLKPGEELQVKVTARIWNDDLKGILGLSKDLNAKIDSSLENVS